MAASRLGAFRHGSSVTGGPQAFGQRVQRGILISQLVQGDMGVQVTRSVPGEAFNSQTQDADAEFGRIGARVSERAERIADGLPRLRQAGRTVDEKALRLPDQEAQGRSKMEQEAG